VGVPVDGSGGCPGKRQLVGDARRVLLQALREAVPVGEEVVRCPPARIPGEVGPAISAFGQGRNILRLDLLQHVDIRPRVEDDAVVGVPEPDRHRPGASNRLDPLAARRLEIDHGHPRDATLGQVLIDEVGLLQACLRPCQDRIFDLNHRGAQPAWGGRRGGQSAAAASRENDERDAHGEHRQLALHGRQHARSV